jgi:hypothetical protein
MDGLSFQEAVTSDWTEKYLAITAARRIGRSGEYDADP